jgi:small subunit ribosomal protein S6
MLVLRAYELMVIVDSDATDPQIKEIIANVDSAVTADGGRVAKVDNWGRRRFAYEIRHKWEGTYVVFDIATPASDLHELDRQLRIADLVVRHKVIRLPDHEGARRGLLGADTPAAAG